MIVTLAAGELRATLAPARGGGVLQFTHRGRAIFAPTPQEESSPARLACFPMAPFVNRVAQGKFAFAGAPYALAPDPLGGAHALHGDAWRRAWTVESTSPASAHLSLVDGPYWPWRRRVEQRFDLTPTTMTIRLRLTNTDARAAPAALGLHPTFADRAHARLHMSASGFHPMTDDLLPLPVAPTPSRWDFSGGRPLADAAPLDHCFVGWPGRARIEWPELAVDLEAENCGHVQIYAPIGADTFCFEPQTAAPDALNHPDRGLSVLQPGDSLTMAMTLRVSA